MPLTNAAHVPRATYRVQLHRGFDFAALRGRLHYLKSLSISDIYLSPIFTATPGSLHGYDVCDYHSINEELGGREGFRRLIAEGRALGLSFLLDFVPNHMGIAGPLNRWWRDVLANGRQSPYADFFDIRWNVEPGEDRPKVMVPLLEDHYGRVLEDGKISVGFEGEFFLRYQDITLPMSPRSYAALLGTWSAETSLPAAGRAALAPVVRALGTDVKIASADRVAKQEYATRIAHWKSELLAVMNSHPALRRKLEDFLRAVNGRPGEPESFVTLNRIAEEQHYRMVRWQAGAHEINYRRFFAIDSLVGLRMERPEVFESTHRLLAELIREHSLAGLRIDHIDGLREPAKYLRNLQALTGAEQGRPFYVVVEKILAGNEVLPESWPVHGTTGYEFIPQIAALFVNRTAGVHFDRIYANFTGARQPWTDVVREKKQMIISVLFANAVNNLGAELTQIVNGDWRWRDLTRHELTTAVSETIANLGAYRAYREGGHVAAQDRAMLEAACNQAIAHNPLADPQPFLFLRDLLTGAYPRESAPAEYRQALTDWVATFQQYTGAVMAKSVEDTAYYTYCRLIALNEVGGDPGQFGGTVEVFHEANRRRLRETPLSLLTTSTHDTKLSEDVRARLYTLSDIPYEWENWIAGWHEQNARHLTRLKGGAAPDPVDEYRFYQVLLGAWPLHAGEVDNAFRKRLREHFRKAVDEAKRHTSMLHPNPEYHAACARFVDATTSREHAPDFLASFEPAARRVARLGMINSLVQLVLKCTVPGVPDLYQGNESWDFSLVDPDNRRAIDFDHRERLHALAASRRPSELFTAWEDGAIKLKTTQLLLTLRARHPELFAHGTYQPLEVRGEFSDRALAFIRADQHRSIMVVVPHLAARLGSPPLGLVWSDTEVDAPAMAAGWRDIFTQRQFLPAAKLALSDLFIELPYTVLESLPTPSP